MTIRELQFFVNQYEELKRIARSIHQLDVNDCNAGLTKRQKTRQKNLLRKAENIAVELGFRLYHQGDPRGLPLYLVEKENEENYHGNGIPIFY